MKSRLVIHMDDRSTDFLKPIYRGTTGTVVTRPLPSSLINDLIDEHDQVIMLGHGCSTGLFSLQGGLIIDEMNVEALREKTDSIFIWCHASTFMKENDLLGFATGMFVSEVGEAVIYNLDPDKEKIEESNRVFAELVSEHLDENIDVLYERVHKNYDMGDWEVPAYNRNLLTWR